ncbi:nuclear transport factor 2 family protein [Spongiimicrobium sp. 3-5]|uniref:nuclear transport factor 2 family protein n=1 Tax=Spongiimicrobium sp. 3-5 TaxID=3332596 RepID=UPI00397F929D
MYSSKSKAIETVVNNYFEGLFLGNVDQLKNVFDKQAVVYGDIHGEVFEMPIGQFLARVKQRKSPNDLNETFKMKVLGIEAMGHNAMVKAHVPMLGKNYYDFLSLHCSDKEWKIVNKLFTHVEG